MRNDAQCVKQCIIYDAECVNLMLAALCNFQPDTRSRFLLDGLVFVIGL